ncbi:hypothetical protein DP117_31020 [Brasilonema sp. UFV-L1]|nr:hypothetical protein [Brasilonema sp. UFV-L1]
MHDCVCYSLAIALSTCAICAPRSSVCAAPPEGLAIAQAKASKGSIIPIQNSLIQNSLIQSGRKPKITRVCECVSVAFFFQIGITTKKKTNILKANLTIDRKNRYKKMDKSYDWSNLID